MRRPQLPISTLPAWSKLNGVVFQGTGVQSQEGKGLGIVASKRMTSDESTESTPLLSVPGGLILCAKFIEEHAKVDQHFRELLEACGGKSFRADAMLFLLIQITIFSPDCPHGVGVSNPWTEYVRILPDVVPVPTTWNDEMRTFLQGTSLETALAAKMVVLEQEFEDLRETTADFPWCLKAWWESDSLELKDWITLDSWFRSRGLELPLSGESMVPCVDLANHATYPNAFYEQSGSGEVALSLRPGAEVESGSEITIGYGSAKSSAEMLFSYGFVDEATSSDGLVLPLSPLPDDPLGKAKVVAFSTMPAIRISDDGHLLECSSPFAYFMSLNEEDGLEFKILQENDGSTGDLKVFWAGKDVTSMTDSFENLISQHPKEDVFKLRAAAILQDRLQEQLERLYDSEDLVSILTSQIMEVPYKEVCQAATTLRQRERKLLERAFMKLESKKTDLLESPAVIEYLGSTGGVNEMSEQQGNDSGEEDFS